MKESDIQSEIQKTLSSLDNIQPADPGPYFYSRMMARQQSEQIGSIGLVWKLAFAMILVINILTFAFSGSNSETTSADPMDQLSANYFGGDSEFYDLAYNN